MADPVVLSQVADKVATLTFNRPDKLNALSGELLSSSIELLGKWARDPEIGAIVVTGVGRAFCAGGDVSAMGNAGERSLEENIDRLRDMQRLSWLLYDMPKVTIAAVNGFAMGAGLELPCAATCGLPRTRPSSARPTRRSALAATLEPVGYSRDWSALPRPRS